MLAAAAACGRVYLFFGRCKSRLRLRAAISGNAISGPCLMVQATAARSLGRLQTAARAERMKQATFGEVKV